MSKKKLFRACMVAYTFYDYDVRVRRYAEALMEEGWGLDIFCLRTPGQPQKADVNGAQVFRIQRREKNEKGKLSYLLRLLHFLIRSGLALSWFHMKRPYAIVHVHSVPDFEIFSALIPKIFRAKLILDIHDIVPEFYASKFTNNKSNTIISALMVVEKVCCSFADHVIIANDIWRERIIARSVQPEKCTTIINYPVTKIFHQNRPKRKNAKFTMIYPGTIAWHQGLDIAAKALQTRKQELPDFLFEIYGDGPETDSLSAIIRELKMDDCIHIKNPLPMKQIAEKMYDADLAIVPKRADGFGNDAFSTKIMEFMTLGVPIIASRTRVDQFYFHDGIICFFESGNVEDLGRKIVDLVNDPERRKELVQNSFKFIEDNTWEKKKDSYLQIIKHLISPEVFRDTPSVP